MLGYVEINLFKWTRKQSLKSPDLSLSKNADPNVCADVVVYLTIAGICLMLKQSNLKYTLDQLIDLGNPDVSNLHDGFPVKTM